MLAISSITKKFRVTDEPILKTISFTVNSGERVGIVGRNGAGKTTLLRIITGELAPDSGSILLTPADLRIGYLPQGLTDPNDTLLEDVLYPQLANLRQTENEVEQLGEAIAIATDTNFDSVMEAYGVALEKLELFSHQLPTGNGEAILAGLGLAHFALDTPIGHLSGGQKTRLGLASLLVNNPQLLILDEPTNHLDIRALEWLEDWLLNFDGGVLIVSHDRTFLDATVTSIVALDDQTHTAKIYHGNYRDYAHTVKSERDKQWSKWRDQQTEIARLQHDVQQTMAKAVRKENSTKDSTQRRYAKKVAARAKAKETRLKRYMDSDERVEKVSQTWNLKLDFGDLPPTGQDVIFLEDVAIGYESEQPLVDRLNLTVRAGERVAVLGPNGHGKSTLLKTVVGELPPLAGRVRIGASIKIGYLAQEQDTLNPAQTVLEHLMNIADMGQTEARSFLHFFLFSGDAVFQPISLLSYGERTRVMLALLVAKGANLLVLDEPINHLDIPSRELFEQALDNFQGSILAVVHDRYFVDKFATTLWHVEDGKLDVEIMEPLLAD